MLRVKDQICIIVGGGAVAARKAADLINAGAQVMIISPEQHPQLEALENAGRVEVRHEAYSADLLQSLDPKPLLVFAATDNHEVNAQVASDARSIGALADILSDAADSDFVSMARVQHGDITIALSTGGASPALTAHLREKIEQVIGDEYATLASWMRESRGQIRETISTQSARRDVWHTIIASAVLDHLRDGNVAGARILYDQILNERTNTNAS